MGGTDCSAAQSGNEGCGTRSPSSTSFGSGFNSVGGGVYASEFLAHLRSNLAMLMSLDSVLG